MIENVKYDVAYSEVFEILNFLGEEYINKIPAKLYKEIDEKRRKKYSSNFITKEKKIDESKISKSAVAIFAILNYNYFVNDEEEKRRIENIWKPQKQ